jgi:hypothetical protein
MCPLEFWEIWISVIPLSSRPAPSPAHTPVQRIMGLLPGDNAVDALGWPPSTSIDKVTEKAEIYLYQLPSVFIVCYKMKFTLLLYCNHSLHSIKHLGNPEKLNAWIILRSWVYTLKILRIENEEVMWNYGRLSRVPKWISSVARNLLECERSVRGSWLYVTTICCHYLSARLS